MSSPGLRRYRWQQRRTRLFNATIGRIPFGVRHTFTTLIAKVLHAVGVKPGVSTGICGGVTYGYGKCDNNGYWTFLYKIEYD